MPRTAIRLAAVCVVALVVAACAGDAQPGNVILAVAFGLDDASPAMTAYVGDPAEAPFRLPAGRYYIEALDSDDVLISSGAQDLEEGEAVHLPTPHEDQTSVRSDGRAEPLITIATFLFDVELAKFEYFDIVTGHYSATPFDSALDLDADDFLPLMARISEIGDATTRQVTTADEVSRAIKQVVGNGGVFRTLPWV